MEIYNFEQFQNNTRIVIEPVFSDLLMHILQFHEKSIDYILNKDSYIEQNDFVIFELNNPNIDWNSNHFFKPNVLLLNSANDYTQELISTITPGGIFIYNGSDQKLVEVAENSNTFFRKIQFETPSFEKNNTSIILETEIGQIPVSSTDENFVAIIEGCKHLCQQLGIMEEDFYEAIMDFKE